MLVSIAALSMAAAAVLAPVQNAPPPGLDIVTSVFSPDQRKMIARDAHCRDASAAAEQFAETNGRDLHVALGALKAIEHCASIARIGDWKDYDDYLWTAAAGIAYDIGVVAREPKGFRHAIAAAQNVSGFDAPSSMSVEVTTRNPYSDSSAVHEPRTAAVNDSTDAGIPTAGNSHFATETVHRAGYSGNFGGLATQVAAAAHQQLQLIESAAK